MRIKYFLSLFLLLVILNCDGKDSKNTHANQSKIIIQDMDEYLSLNNNNKWQMDTHTRTSIGKMIVISTNKSLSSKDIGIQIQEELNILFNGCTMQGDAHNELHKFLQLYIPVVNQLKETGNDTDLNKLKNQLIIYQKYFK